MTLMKKHIATGADRRLVQRASRLAGLSRNEIAPICIFPERHYITAKIWLSNQNGLLDLSSFMHNVADAERCTRRSDQYFPCQYPEQQVK